MLSFLRTFRPGLHPRLPALLLPGLLLLGMLYPALVLCCVQPDPVQGRAVTLASGFRATPVAVNLARPTAMSMAPDGRIFICEQGGALRVVKNGFLLPTPFVRLSVNDSGERGLLGVTFDPDFETNQRVYLYATTSGSPIHNRVTRYTGNGDVVTPGSQVVILDLNNLSDATNHNGGAIHFGPDGLLYIAVGENANPSNSQTLNNLLGKILRIAGDGSIPASNPFYNQTAGKNRAIWALGLRNPYTFAFQPGTGRMFINDVGQNTWEEINDGIGGSNYGWPVTEGPTNDPRFRGPLYSYDHGTGCAITGGAFYNPETPQFPIQYRGKYFFSDYCASWIKVFDPATRGVATLGGGFSSPVDLLTAPDGSLYCLTRGDGSNTGVLYRIQYGGDGRPIVTENPADQTVPVGGTATFTINAAGQAPLSYQWQRNGVTIQGATAATYRRTGVTASDNGARFRCVVSNSAGSDTSAEAVLTVTPNRAPVGSITAPVSGTRYSGGDVINYSGSGTDPEDGTLPPGAFTWEVRFYHDTHFHPFVPPTTGSRTGSFTIPRTGETAANVWYRILLTVRDSVGLTHTTYRDVLPRRVTLSFQTQPSGLQVTLDGQPRVTPFSVTGVVGINRSIGAVSPQSAYSSSFVFASWSDGGTATHAIVTPSASTGYTAVYRDTGLAAPSRLTATVTSTSSIQLSWQDNTGNETGYRVERRIGDAAFTQIALLPANTRGFTNTGLTSNLIYSYRVRASRDPAFSAYSNTVSLKLGIPAAPTNLQARVAARTQINLTWTGPSGNESGFEVERRKATETAFALLARVGRDIVHYEDRQAAPATSYVYRVRAYNGAGASGFSNAVTATTPQ